MSNKTSRNVYLKSNSELELSIYPLDLDESSVECSSRGWAYFWLSSLRFRLRFSLKSGA